MPDGSALGERAVVCRPTPQDRSLTYNSQGVETFFFFTGPVNTVRTAWVGAKGLGQGGREHNTKAACGREGAQASNTGQTVNNLGKACGQLGYTGAVCLALGRRARPGPRARGRVIRGPWPPGPRPPDKAPQPSRRPSKGACADNMGFRAG